MNQDTTVPGSADAADGGDAEGLDPLAVFDAESGGAEDDTDVMADLPLHEPLPWAPAAVDAALEPPVFAEESANAAVPTLPHRGASAPPSAGGPEGPPYVAPVASGPPSAGGPEGPPYVAPALPVIAEQPTLASRPVARAVPVAPAVPVAAALPVEATPIAAPARPGAGATSAIPTLPVATAPSAARSLTLDVVLARLGHVEWLEAVAIAEGICATLSKTGGSVPEPPGVAIAENGAVIVSGHVSSPPGPPLARLLHALTSGGKVPVQFRLFVSKWIAFAEAHSIADVMGELAYFARPDGAALIRGVYERAATAAPREGDKPPSQKSENEKKEKKAAKEPKPRRRRSPVIPLAAASLLAAAVAGLTWSNPEVLNTAQQMSLSLPSGLGNLFGGTATDADATAGTEPTDDAAAERPANTRRSATARGAAPLPSSRVTTSPAARAAGTGGQPPFTPLSLPQIALSAPAEHAVSGSVGIASGAADPASLRLGSSAFRAQADEDAGVVYSRGDAGVIPPRIRYPALPPPLATASAGEVNTMELIISETGSVERVRLLSEPRRMADMMMLSGAKAWVFEPAYRGGEAVRYRLLVSWHPTP